MSAHTEQHAGRLKIVLAFVFGCATVPAVLWLAFARETLSQQQFEILRIVLALAGAGVAAVIPGFLEVRMTTGKKLAIRAGGAVAVFVVLYFFSPQHWTEPGPGAVIQHTGGTGSSAQNGHGNTVINNITPPK